MVAVFNDSEMDRIVALPKRDQDWPADKAAEACRLVTAWLKTPYGTMVLKPKQAQFLAECHDVGAVVGLLGPGAGKTLISAVLPFVVSAKRTLLLVPAMLRIKTIDDFRDLSYHFKIPKTLLVGQLETVAPDEPVIRVLSYESLSTVNYATFIEEFDPDLIIADEAHCLQTLKSGRSRRVFRFIKNKRKRGGKVKFVPLTGTGWTKSLRQVAHLFEAALEKGSPIPQDYISLENWSMAIDRNVREDVRQEPGALLRLQSSTTQPVASDIDSVRRSVRDRILSTAGVVATKESACGLPLILQRRLVTVPPEVRSAMAALREDYLLPSGDKCEKGVSFWAHTRQIADGFSYFYDPPPPAAWRSAKSKWITFVNEAMKGRSNLDTPLQVWNAVEAGKFGYVAEWVAWRDIRDSFKPNTKPAWVSDYLIRDAEKWALETGGIVWVSHAKAYTDEPDDDTLGGQFKGLPYFGAGDERIKTYKGPCVASIRAHGTGKNLYQWDESLIMTMPSSGKTIEQLLARLHREGQRSDTVRFHFYAHSLENVRALRTCLDDADYIEATSGSEQRVKNAHLLDHDGSSFKLDEFMFKQTEVEEVDPMWG